MAIFLQDCRSPLGLRGLKSLSDIKLKDIERRSPLGLRGLKSAQNTVPCDATLSQPSWAAWIEIFGPYGEAMKDGSQPSWAAWIEMEIEQAAMRFGWMSQPSWAAWIEIIVSFLKVLPVFSRSPLGLRGLKSYAVHQDYQVLPSQPSWAAWIEIFTNIVYCISFISRSPLGLRGLKFTVRHSAFTLSTVAALLGCVD